MSDLDPLRRGARLVRRLPFYRWLRRQLVPRLRRNRMLRVVSHRIWGVRPGRRQRVSSDIHPGSVLGGIGTEHLPVVAFLILEQDEEALGRIVDEIAVEQLLTASFRPVVLIDTPSFHLTRRYGFVTELLPRPSAWHDSVVPWDAHLAGRLRSAHQHYGVTGWIQLGSGGLDPVARAQLYAYGTPDRPDDEAIRMEPGARTEIVTTAPESDADEQSAG